MLRHEIVGTVEPRTRTTGGKAGDGIENRRQLNPGDTVLAGQSPAERLPSAA